MIHDIYVELTKMDYHLQELYEMSIKELLFELKYAREGRAYDYWKIGIATRYAFGAKNFPKSPKDLSEELYEKPQAGKMPDWLKDDYNKKINNKFNRR